jgi:hypothetical protein
MSLNNEKIKVITMPIIKFTVQLKAAGERWGKTVFIAHMTRLARLLSYTHLNPLSRAIKESDENCSFLCVADFEKT